MLEIDGVSKRYGDVVAADDVTMAVKPGSLVGFVGRNGSGKTTTMRIALGLVAPDHGEVRFDGHPATTDDRRRHVGYLPEERGLYPQMRVLDQLIYLARLSGLAAPDAVDSSKRWLDRLGIAERATSRLEELSLGNQQRVQLAAALVHRPRTLVLDEPFSGLDPVGVDVMAEVLGDEVREGAGVVFSSHQLELVERLCDELVIIDGGRVVAAGATVGAASRSRRAAGGDRGGRRSVRLGRPGGRSRSRPHRGPAHRARPAGCLRGRRSRCCPRRRNRPPLRAGHAHGG